MNDAPVALVPLGERWRPTRAGLVSLWRYWDEEFAFHRGRLLLRGPNGAGKSLALELLLPFLLDADASPSRLTSGTRSRGRLFDRVMTGTDEPTRTGFAWVEFRRGSEVFTIGARIRASQSTRRAEADFFTTTLAVGEGLQLLDSNRVALSRQALVEAIGDTGRVHGSGEAHRAAVREVLFPGFGADRYRALVGALLTLRKEKLSQQLVNVEALSSVLSEALPPLDDYDIATVAEGFERLDRRRTELDILADELREVRALAARQREYARAVIVAGSAEVISAETRRDNVTREERKASDGLEAARMEAEAAEAELRSREERIEAIGVEVDARKDSDAYKEGGALVSERQNADRLVESAQRQRNAAEAARAASGRAEEEHADRERATKDTTANLEQAVRELGTAAGPVGGVGIVSEAEVSGDAEEGARLLRAWIEARRSLLAELRTALKAHSDATLRRELRQEQVEEAEKELIAHDDAHRRALTAAAEAVSRYATDVGEWASTCAVMGAERVVAALPRPADDPDQVGPALADLRTAVESELAVIGRDLEAAYEAAEQERAVLRDERARWEQSALPDVEAPAWRSARDGLPGAPLWLLVDPVADADHADVDRVEAALTAAGLLDAWVRPDGSLALSDGRADVVLTARPSSAPTTLASLLAPATGNVDDDLVATVLASIPLVSTVTGPGAAQDPEVAIGRDGTYRLGNAFGRGPDRPARVLGSPARERHRQARLAEIDEALVVADERLEAIDRQRDDLKRRISAVRSEFEAAPSGALVSETRQEVEVAADRLGRARAQVGAARALVREAEDAVRAALRSLTALSAQHGLPADDLGLGEVERGLRRLEEAVTTWGRRSREAEAAATELQRAAERARDAAGRAEQAAADHMAAARAAEDAKRRVAVLEASVGVPYHEVLDQIAALESERSEASRRRDVLREKTPGLQKKVGALSESLRNAAEARQRAEEDRLIAHRHLVATSDDLLPDTGIEPPASFDGISAVLAFARAVLGVHGGVRADQEAIERSSERVREQVHQARLTLGARVDVDRELSEGWWVLRTVHGGFRRHVGELAEALASELERGRTELAEEEERLFEQTLAGSIRRALADRIREANALVANINHELDSIRTAAAGVGVRLTWLVDPDQPDAVKAARALLLRDPADLRDGERASLQEFVRARVDQARAELEGNAPWEARLRESLDYRRWHRFTLQIAHRDWDGYQPATAKRLGALSTGERSVALHLPMIASVAAHYSVAKGDSVSPRLILLDELFAGVDAANRAQLFGTFTAWDLDAVFTSDHEWCQYATLDGIAIHHMHPGGKDEPVTSTRFTWDGRQRRIDPIAAASRAI